MGKNTLSEFIVRQIQNITIEPVLFVYAFGLGVVAGAQINTNLLIWKICNLELKYPEDVCGNLSNDAYKEIEEEVQENVNNFQMKSQWISSVPIIFFSIIAGALSGVNFINILHSAFTYADPKSAKRQSDNMCLSAFFGICAHKSCA